jgi:hypothetical protein
VLVRALSSEFAKVVEKPSAIVFFLVLRVGGDYLGGGFDIHHDVDLVGHVAPSR